MKGSRILLLGIAYKKDIDDRARARPSRSSSCSPSSGAEVSYHDPHVPEAPRDALTGPTMPACAACRSTRRAVEAQDAVVVVTDHSSVDYELVRRHAALIVDTRGIYRGGGDNVVQA